MADTCVFNLYVTCSPDSCGQCKSCGWNPLVDAKRREAVKKHGK